MDSNSNNKERTTILKSTDTDTDRNSLLTLLQERKWDEATLLANSESYLKYESKMIATRSYSFYGRSNTSLTSKHHQSGSSGVVPLSLACRYGAPLSCIQAILNANPKMVRIGDGMARGSPLHEAIVNPDCSLSVISMLIQSDEQEEQKEKFGYCGLLQQASSEIEVSSSASSSSAAASRTTTTGIGGTAPSIRKDRRAVLVQDADGQTPLHLLIRRCFQFYTQDDEDETNSTSSLFKKQKKNIIDVVRQLVKSCPESCAIPNKQDYEETPLVLTLKANDFASFNITNDTASMNSNEDNEKKFESLVEERIRAITNIMVTYYPASLMLNTQSAGYTPLHSAIFHGRCKETIQSLLMTNDSIEQIPQDIIPPVLCQNEMRLETPLHFAAMKGESLDVIKLLVTQNKVGRKAVMLEDLSGLFPLHWLWIRVMKEMNLNFRTTEKGTEGQQSEEENITEIEQTDEAILTSPEAIATVITYAEQLLDDELQTLLVDEYCYTDESSINSNANNAISKISFLSGKALVERKAQSSKSSSAFLSSSDFSRYKSTSFGEDVTFDESYFHLMKELDPSLDYRDMRHLPAEYTVFDSCCADTLVWTLNNIKQKYLTGKQRAEENSKQKIGSSDDSCNQDTSSSFFKFTQNDAMSLLFWKKAECLLRAAAMVNYYDEGDCLQHSSDPVHTENDVVQASLSESSQVQQASLASKQTAISPSLASSPSCTTTQEQVLEEKPQESLTSNKNPKFLLVHTAARNCCCPPSVLRVAMSLKPSQLKLQDFQGNLPLHLAASRPVHYWQLSSSTSSDEEEVEDDTARHQAANIIDGAHFQQPEMQRILSLYESNDPSESDNDETYYSNKCIVVSESALNVVFSYSSKEASRTYNNEKRLPLHMAIDNILLSFAQAISIKALAPFVLSPGSAPRYLTTTTKRNNNINNQSQNHLSSFVLDAYSPLHFLKPLLISFPESLERRDGKTKLYPFMQASATSTVLANAILMQHEDDNTKSRIISASSRKKKSSSFSAPPHLLEALKKDKKESTVSSKSNSQTQEKYDAFSLISLTIVYKLLRENPTLVTSGIPEPNSCVRRRKMMSGDNDISNKRHKKDFL